MACWNLGLVGNMQHVMICNRDLNCAIWRTRARSLVRLKKAMSPSLPSGDKAEALESEALRRVFGFGLR